MLSGVELGKYTEWVFIWYLNSNTHVMSQFHLIHSKSWSGKQITICRLSNLSANLIWLEINWIGLKKRWVNLIWSQKTKIYRWAPSSKRWEVNRIKPMLVCQNWSGQQQPAPSLSINNYDCYIHQFDYKIILQLTLLHNIILILNKG